MTTEKVESLRRKTKNTIFFGSFLIILLAIIIIILSFTMREERLLIFSFIIVVFGIIIVLILSYFPNKKYKEAYKETFVLKSLKSIFTDLVYEPNEELDPSIIRNTKMMNMGNRYSSNDYISGKYKDIKFEQADVHIEEERVVTDSKGNTHVQRYTLFRGRWMVFDFNKEFAANMQVREKGFSNSKISNWGSELKFGKIKLEDEEFNKKFKVYAQDAEEAFYILTPQFMDKIKKVCNNTSGNLLFCFVNNKLHIGLNNNKDSFEPKIFSPIVEEEVINSISSDMKVITDFVDELNLDNDLFKKGGTK